MRPFDRIAGELIDLSKQEHRDEIIQRNKELDKSVTEGLTIQKMTTKVVVRSAIHCLKCGTYIEEDKSFFYMSHDQQVIDHLPKLECYECSTVYKYIPEKGVYKVKLLEPQHKAKKIK